MASYSPIIVLIVNVLRVLLLKKVMDVFLPADDIEEKPLKIGMGIYCLLTTTMYSRQYIPNPIFSNFSSISSTDKNTSMTFFKSKVLRTFTINTIIGLYDTITHLRFLMLYYFTSNFFSIRLTDI